jgi:large subunit ribosomal protein L25
VVYGLGEGNQHVTVDAREIMHILASESGTNTVITLRGERGDQMALIRQIQSHPVRHELLHVDFVRVRADVEVSAEVPVNLVGEPEGVRNGGMLDQILFTLTVLARPADIPNGFEYDVSALDVGDQLRVGELTIPAGVTVQNEPDELVATIASTAAAAAEEAEGEEAEGEGEAEGAAGEAESSGE